MCQKRQQKQTTSTLKLPGAHGRHGPASGPVVPALHPQAAAWLIDTNPGGHTLQASDPIALLYFPSAHNEQLPIAPVYPGGHGPQSALLGPRSEIARIDGVLPFATRTVLPSGVTTAACTCVKSAADVAPGTAYEERIRVNI